MNAKPLLVTVFMAMLVCAGFAPTATALARTSEITDLWWNPAESGWGVNVVLQGDTAFLTFFIYDTAQNPTWVTAQLTQEPGATAWSGGVYVTKGPWFGGAFPPANVSVRSAGTARFLLSDVNAATLTYTVDGVAVTKSVVRQTFRNEDYTGVYAGGYSVRASNCNPSTFNGVTETTGTLNVTQNGTSSTMVATTSLGTCTFTGTYAQAGKQGTAQGAYSCTTGESGSFEMLELTPTPNGFTGRVHGSNQVCQWAGYIGGISRAQ